MIFSKIDNKNKCKSIFANGAIYDEYNPDMLYTWAYQANLPARAKFLKLYVPSGQYEDHICEKNKIKFDSLQANIKNILKSYSICGYDPREYCLDEMVDSDVIGEYFNIMNETMQNILDNVPEPENYEQLSKIEKITTDIATRRLNLNLSKIYDRQSDNRVKKLIKRYSKDSAYINYNMYGTITGRLSTFPSSFPILTLNKEYRRVLEPNNDLFLEFDYNAFELRVLLALSGKQQPNNDMHDWNIQNVFKGNITRDEAKKRMFAWLYNPDSSDHSLDQSYEKDKILKESYDGKNIETVFKRKIESDGFHALNYLIQSTASDLFLEQVYKVFELLKDKKSSVAMLIHDSMIIDFSKEDYQLLEEIKKMFMDTRFGEFKTGIKIGQNLLDLRSSWK
tara:strand:+ start:1989 stop:3170 length:1182 start_codon:yes stop_codon:yes gene_type:complete